MASKGGQHYEGGPCFVTKQRAAGEECVRAKGLLVWQGVLIPPDMLTCVQTRAPLEFRLGEIPMQEEVIWVKQQR